MRITSTRARRREAFWSIVFGTLPQAAGYPGQRAKASLLGGDRGTACGSTNSCHEAKRNNKFPCSKLQGINKLKKEDVVVDEWIKDLAPSVEPFPEDLVSATQAGSAASHLKEPSGLHYGSEGKAAMGYAGVARLSLGGDALISLSTWPVLQEDRLRIHQSIEKMGVSEMMIGRGEKMTAGENERIHC